MIKRVVWKDCSKAKTYKPLKYRKHFVTGYNGGWVIDVPGDQNIYQTHYDALNAIDKHLGGYGQKGDAKRKAYGIAIIGKKGGETA